MGLIHAQPRLRQAPRGSRRSSPDPRPVPGRLPPAARPLRSPLLSWGALVSPGAIAAAREPRREASPACWPAATTRATPHRTAARPGPRRPGSRGHGSTPPRAASGSRPAAPKCPDAARGPGPVTCWVQRRAPSARVRHYQRLDHAPQVSLDYKGDWRRFGGLVLIQNPVLFSFPEDCTAFIGFLTLDTRRKVEGTR
ncbi:hypothetical protein NDU88_003237 [Pleurodeles waltl]|uniref:Uncharacterized protein n=1 Tax=Pleurodeles waltl TaxID=8319 RepID=A0AAV7KWH6_PLEWA|nr:hypothetical protein NDU88_003237 [Pleurodeles waltl]